jgi:hypothetical protein
MRNKPSKQPSYTIQAPVSYEDVPNWARRPAKWDKLVEAILALDVGTSQPVKFDAFRDTELARNTIRDSVNREYGNVLIRTRLVKENGGALPSLRLSPNQRKSGAFWWKV